MIFGGNVNIDDSNCHWLAESLQESEMENSHPCILTIRANPYFAFGYENERYLQVFKRHQVWIYDGEILSSHFAEIEKVSHAQKV